MPGFFVFDRLINFKGVNMLSMFISVAVPIATIIMALSWGVDIYKLWKNKKHAGVLKTLGNIALTIFLILIVLYDYDGRYSKNDIELSWKENCTYFGEVKNNVPHGWGKLYDEDENLYYVGEFKNGKREGEGKEYSLSDDDTPYITYEGNYLDNMRNGFGTEWEYIEESVIRYKGGFLANDYNGYGEYKEYNKYGEITLSYKGGWAYGYKYGYGEEIHYSYDDDNNKEADFRYRGTYWKSKRHGEGIIEYLTNEDAEVVFHGMFDDDTNTLEGCYYKGNGTEWFTTTNNTRIDIYENGMRSDEEEEIPDGIDRVSSENNIELMEQLKSKWPYPKDCIWQ